MAGQVRLRMTSVRKSFDATPALRGVSLEVAAGEVHALIGGNGAGKSTLMKVLSGACRPDAGTIELDGAAYRPADPLHARRCGIAMIYQELNLAPHLTVEENIVLGAEPSRFGWIDRRRRREAARRALAALSHEDIPPDVPVNRLGIAAQQVVEIARAIAGSPRVLIMDEPTSSLSKPDAEGLFRVVERLRDSGVSIIYISHFLEECQRICDRYTVLRDGETVGSGEMRGASLSGIISLMAGREISEAFPRSPGNPGRTVLEVRSVAGRRRPRSVSFRLRAGEILGVAGLIGAGRTETVRACFGLDRLRRGSVAVLGRERRRASPSASLREGMGLLSENRKEEGLMAGRSIADNLTLTHNRPFGRFGFISGRSQRLAAAEWMRRLGVRAQGPAQAVGELSGGNQQKVAIGRLLHHDASILLLDEPTRGIDVASKTAIYGLMNDLACSGKAIVFISSWLPELLGMCDTIGVMCRGELVAVKPAQEWTEEEIIRTAVGQGGEAETATAL